MKTSHQLAVLLVSPMYLFAVPVFAQTGADNAQTAETKLKPASPELANPQPEKLPVYPPEPMPSDSPWPRQKTVGITVMALGGASLAVGLAMGVTALIKYTDLGNQGCTERECPSSMNGDLAGARTFANVSTGTLIGGLAAWTGGIFILATAAAPSTMGARVTPILGLNKIGVTVSF